MARDRASSRPRRPRILIVDDEPAIRSALNRYLTRKGCEVGEAANGDEALHVLRTSHVDAILCDLHMPGVDGVGLWDALGRERPDLRRRIVFVSALPLPRALEHAAALRYVAKPFELNEIWQALTAILASDRS